MMVQYVVIALGAIFALIGIALFIKGVGGGGNDSKLRFLGIEASGVAPGLIVFLVGCGLVYAAAQMNVFKGDEQKQAAQSATNANGNGDQSSAATDDAQPSIEIKPPAYNTVKKGDGGSNVRWNDGSWLFDLTGTAGDLPGAPARRVYLLYREVGATNSWYVQHSGAVGGDGKWEASAWVDASKFESETEHEFEVCAVATAEQLAEGSKIEHDFSRVHPLRSASNDNSDSPEYDKPRDFEYDVRSEPLKLKMLKPE